MEPGLFSNIFSEIQYFPDNNAQDRGLFHQSVTWGCPLSRGPVYVPSTLSQWPCTSTKRQVFLGMGGATTVRLTLTACPDSLNRRPAIEAQAHKRRGACIFLMTKDSEHASVCLHAVLPLLAAFYFISMYIV